MFKRLLKAGAIALSPVLALVGLGEAGCKKTTSGDKPPDTGATGTTQKADPAPEPAPGPSPAAKAGGAQQRIDEVTAEAQAVVSGQRGEHPFDRAGKEKLLSALRAVETDVEALVSAGTISLGAAGLWVQDLRQLASKVGGYRPTEMKTTTCYEPQAMPIAARKSALRLKVRLAALEKLAAEEKLNAEVVGKVLEQVEADLEVVSSEEELRKLRKIEERVEAKKLAVQVQASLIRIRSKLAGTKGAGPMALVDDFFVFIKPLAENSSKSTSAQRKVATEKKEKALAALPALIKSGVFTDNEAKLVTLEAERLRREMIRSRPADSQVKCYKRVMHRPARKSLERLNKRMPLLEKLAAEGKLKPAVVKRVLPILEQDIETLTEPDELRRLDKKELPKAAAAAARARKMLQRLNKLK